MAPNGGRTPDPLRPLIEHFVAERDAAAMEEFVARTRRRLIGVARRIGAPQDAEDTVQAAYHALLARPSLPDAPMLAWLMTTVIRIAYRRKAVERRQTRIAERLARPNADASPHERVARSEETALVRSEVGRLPANYRHALVLYYLEGLSSAEIARLLDVSPSTVTTRLQRGRQLMRSRLDPRFALGLLFLPWLLFDAGRALAGAPLAPIGGVVTAKSGMLLAAVGVAAGTMGAVIGATVLSGDGTERGSRLVRRENAADVTLEARLEERDAEVRELRDRIEAYEARAPVGTEQPAPAPRMSMLSLIPREEPYNFERARASAERLRVTEEELRIAVSVYRAIKNKSDPALRKQAEEALRSLGDRRTRAVAAMLRGIEQGELGGGTVRKLVALGHVEGQEQLYIDVLKDDVTSSYTKNEVLRHLDAMPSQAVRDYLLERLEGEENVYFASSLIMSLGRLKERRAIPLLAKELSREDRTAHHIFSLIALGKIGGPAAESVLIDYVRRPKPLHVIRALNALAKINVALARGEAQSILASPKAERLSTGVKEALRQY